MMKKLFLVSILVLSMVACGNSNKQADKTAEGTEKTTVDAPLFELDELLAKADDYVGKQVKVSGYVTHTCKHSGRRCFIVGESQEYSMRVEAKGNIGGFNRELAGSKIEILGTFLEKRMSIAEIDALEKTIEEKRIQSDGSAEACDAETANVEKMRKLMKEKGKDYYSIYSLDGEDFTEIK